MRETERHTKINPNCLLFSERERERETKRVTERDTKVNPNCSLFSERERERERERED